MKIAAFDIEASSLNAAYGMLLCACVGDIGSDKIETFTLRNYRKRGENIFDAERRTLIDISARLLESDVLLGWYSKKFDHPIYKY